MKNFLKPTGPFLIPQVTAIIFLATCFSFSPVGKDDLPDLVKGKIVDHSNNLPIEKAYIYVVAGEEEALSHKDGSFEIMTWQKFPLTIQINHEQYQVEKMLYKSPNEKPVIRLTPKR